MLSPDFDVAHALERGGTSGSRRVARSSTTSPSGASRPAAASSACVTVVDVVRGIQQDQIERVPGPGPQHGGDIATVR